MDYQKYVDQLVKDVMSFAENVSDVTKQKAGQAKALIDLKKAEGELDKAYRSLGRIMYQIEKGNLQRDDLIVGAAVRQVEYQESVIADLKKLSEAQEEEGEELVSNEEEIVAEEAEEAQETPDADEAENEEPQA
ncbi:MAG: hypothetical protein J6P72_05360 [Firmicutes bacterium]|nr:hypothetical protein [Bacillota bacterium]